MICKRAFWAAAICACIALCPITSLRAQQAQPPQPLLTEDEVAQLIKQSRKDLKPVANMIEQRGVAFDLDAKIEKKLRKAGADDAMIQTITKAGPTGRASRQNAVLTTATGAKLELSPKEGAAFDALRKELDPDRRLHAVDDFEKQFPDTKLRPYLYAEGAKACEDKGDLNCAIQYGEKSLQLDPDNLAALLVVSMNACQPGALQGSASEKNTRLTEAQSDAEHLLKLLDALPKQAGQTDEQFKEFKGGWVADAHFSLGMVALMREDSGKAADEFKTAIASTSSPTPQYYYRLGDAYSANDNKAEAIKAFTKAAEVGKGTPIEPLAQRRVDELRKP